MARNWYQEVEDDMDERNEAIGRAFVAAKNLQTQKENKEEIFKNPTQMSIFGDEETSKKQSNRVGTNRGVEYVRLIKDDPSVRIMRYEEEYVPELDD